MKTLPLLATLAVTLSAVCARAIDFTPHFTEAVDDGVPMRRMYFSDGAKCIFYRPPPTWVQSGGGQAATFRPQDSNFAVVRIENAPAEDACIPFDGVGLEALRSIGLTLVPPYATEVTEIWEVPNPVVLQGWTSFEIGFDYVQFGQRFCRSILFINLDTDRQIHFIVSAAPAEFQQLYKTAYRTLATWCEPTTRTSR